MPQWHILRSYHFLAEVTFKSFKIIVLYGPMFPLHGFRLYNIESFFSTHPNALPYCSVITPHSSKIFFDCVTTDRSLIVTNKKVLYLQVFYSTLLWFHQSSPQNKQF